MEFLDRIWLEDEESTYSNYLHDVGINDKATIGTIVFKDSYEIFVDQWDKETSQTYYCATFEEALEYCKQEYPDANWGVLG